jgi:serine O-acetyltransferase
MVGIPAKPVARRRTSGEPRPGFQPYALGPEIPDPIARALSGLLDEVTSLRARLSELEKSELARSSVEEQSLPVSRGNGADDKKRVT